MNSLRLFSTLSWLGFQAARGSSLSSASAGPSTISALPSLNGTASLLANSTLQTPLSSNDSSYAVNLGGPVTVVRTIELIPQPVHSSPSVPASKSLEYAEDSMSDILPLAINTQRPTLPAVFSPAKLASSFGASASSVSQLQIPRLSGQAVEHPKLQPIVVGGITYYPVHAHHTHSDAVFWQAKPQPSQTRSGAAQWHDDYAKHDSNPYQGNQNEAGSESRAGQAGLPPVVVGGLTYGPIAKGFESGGQTSAPTLSLSLSTEIAQLAALPLVGIKSTLDRTQGGSMAANLQNDPSPGNSGPVQTQSPSLTSPIVISGLVLGSQTLTALSEGSDFIINSSNRRPDSLGITVNSISTSSSDLAFTTPTPSLAVTNMSGALAPTYPFAISGQSIVPASPLTFIIAGETFTAYPSGLAIDGTEVFEGSTGITVSGTTISLGSSDMIIGTRTIPIASISGLGSALSSGLSTGVSTETSGSTSTNQSGKSSHQSAAGQLKALRSAAVVWPALLIALTVSWYVGM